jgi:hypothetical protein
MTAINGFDEISHYLRAALLVNTCSTYVTTEAPSCGAHFTQTQSVQSSSATSVATANDALANKGNAPKQSTNATTALANVAKGLLNLGKPKAPTSAQLQAMNKQGIARIRNGANADSSPALNGVDNGRNQALLNYLLGNN